MTFLSSERDAPGRRWQCCLRARVTRFSAFRDRTMPIFEYTLKAASLKDPASAVPIYRKVAQSDEETRSRSSSTRQVSRDYWRDLKSTGHAVTRLRAVLDGRLTALAPNRPGHQPAAPASPRMRFSMLVFREIFRPRSLGVKVQLSLEMHERVPPAPAQP